MSAHNFIKPAVLIDCTEEANGDTEHRHDDKRSSCQLKGRRQAPQQLARHGAFRVDIADAKVTVETAQHPVKITDGWFDKIMRGLVFVTTAMPAYWVGLLLMWGIGVQLNWLPTNGNGTWRHLILPSFTVALSYISTYIRLIRNNMLENMKQDYVLYANVRGLPQKSILVKHILKNSMHTCIVAMGMSIPQLISGTIVVENVFSWPGLGTLCISSIFNRDYPVIQTYVLLIGVLFVLFNLLFDILQTVSDPRLRKED